MTTIEIRTLHFEPLEDSPEDALTVLDSAARWLRSKGIDQWPENFSGSPRRTNWLTEQIEHRNVFVGYILNTPVSTVTITEWADPDFAPGWEPSSNARYLYRLAVTATGRRLYPGIGAQTLHYARCVAQAQNADVLRLDCVKTNHHLHRYYKNRGFHHVTTIDAPGRRSGTLFQLNLR
jgi:hypothetical protein